MLLILCALSMLTQLHNYLTLAYVNKISQYFKYSQPLLTQLSYESYRKTQGSSGPMILSFVNVAKPK
jgi:hypothetical protein